MICTSYDMYVTSLVVRAVVDDNQRQLLDKPLYNLPHRFKVTGCSKRYSPIELKSAVNPQLAHHSPPNIVGLFFDMCLNARDTFVPREGDSARDKRAPARNVQSCIGL